MDAKFEPKSACWLLLFICLILTLATHSCLNIEDKLLTDWCLPTKTDFINSQHQPFLSRLKCYLPKIKLHPYHITRLAPRCFVQTCGLQSNGLMMAKCYLFHISHRIKSCFVASPIIIFLSVLLSAVFSLMKSYKIVTRTNNMT